MRIVDHRVAACHHHNRVEEDGWCAVGDWVNRGNYSHRYALNYGNALIATEYLRLQVFHAQDLAGRMIFFDVIFQFSKTGYVLKGMGLDGLGKTDAAVEELTNKGMSPNS